MQVYILFLAALCLTHATATQSRCRLPPYKLETICLSPPVDNVVLPSYLATWYQLYTYSDIPTPFLSFPCSTASYSAKPNNRIGVQNCFDPGARGTQAQCVFANATRRPNTSKPAYLQVQFGPRARQGDYNIAALLGDSEYGYYAAAVFNCEFIKGRAVQTWFLIARSPYNARNIRRQLLWRLRCKGYDVYGKHYRPSRQGKGCRYFFGPKGFAKAARGGPPPSVGA